MNEFLLTTILFGIAATIGAMAFLIYEIDRLSRRPTLAVTKPCQYKRRPTLLVGEVATQNTVKVDGRIWDLPARSSVRVGQRVALVLEG